MKQLFVMLSLGLLCLASCGDSPREDTAPIDSASEMKAYAASVSDFPGVIPDAYAPWARMKGDAVPSVHPEDAPKASQIDIPPFPGSHIVRSGKIGEGASALSFVTLICEDSHEAVINFYQDRLTKDLNWSYEDQYNVFQPGKGNEFILHNTPFVSVMGINFEASEMQDVDPEFLQNYRTRIQVTYRPKN
ncbi:MAG: hypothetical protein WBQ23_04750 [Bacteroidota bacterium]